MTKVVSFDVLEACFTQVCGGSHALYSILARQVYKMLGRTPELSDIEDFAAIRVDAEKQIRQQGIPVTLNAIWECVCLMAGWEWSADFEQLEMDVLSENLLPIGSVKSQVEAARDAGQHVAFVSCSSFPEKFIRQLLLAHDLIADGDHLFVSHDADGCSCVFDSSLSVCDAGLSDVLHTGSPGSTMVALARRRGVPVSLIDRNTFSSAETAVLKAGPGHRYLAERLAGVMRSLRATGVERCPETYAELSSQFMAPVTTAFACWILARARERGITRLYFLSRDCQLALKAAQILSPEFGSIDCRYLQVSRQSLLLPSSSEVSEQGMHWLFEEKDAHVLKCLLAKMELRYEELAPFFPQAAEEGDEYVLKTDKDRQAFWEALRQPALCEKLTRLIKTRRDAAHSYFEAMGLFDSGQWAVVDIGWSLNSQRALAALMNSWEREEEVHGFYMGVQHDRQPRKKTGTLDALFYKRTPDEVCKTVQPAVFKFIILIENLFGTADHPTVHHYELNEDGISEPAFKRDVPPQTLARFNALAAGYTAFAERSRSFSKDLSDPAAASAFVEALTLHFLNHATARMVKPLCDIEVAFGQDNLDPFPLVRPLTVREAILPIFPSWDYLRALRKGPRVMWHKGSVLISNPRVRKLYAIAYKIRALRMRVKWLR